MNPAVWPLQPYCGPGPEPAEIWLRWNFDPVLLAVLAAVTLGLMFRPGVSPRQRVWAGAGMVVLLIAFVSPLCALSSALFSARFVHHVLLIGIAAPLLVMAAPGPSPRLVRWLPFLVLIQAAAVWIWHAPAPYAWALSHPAAYWVMQAGLLVPALAFWSALRRATPAWGVGALAATMVQMGLLGALITFLPRAVYTPHFGVTAPWGLTALQDQQLAGLIMWAPAAALYLAVALVRLGLWLEAESRGPETVRS